MNFGYESQRNAVSFALFYLMGEIGSRVFSFALLQSTNAIRKEEENGK